MKLKENLWTLLENRAEHTCCFLHRIVIKGKTHWEDQLVAEVTKTRDAKLISKAPDMYAMMKEFVVRVEKGEIRSEKTYINFKSILNFIDEEGD